YGTLGNCHVEDEERMNSTVRSHLEHTNRQAPSKDLAYRFALSTELQFVAEGGIWTDPHTRTLSSATAQLQNLFQERPMIKLLGLPPPPKSGSGICQLLN